MMPVGIEAINVFGGTACLDVERLAAHRQMDTDRFANLLMKEKTVALPNEDPVSFAVNAAKPLLDALTPAERAKIEMVITCTESSFDFGKSMSTYVQDLLELPRRCRLFELKNACYSGTAGLQMAINFVLSRTSPGAKALVVASDLSRFLTEEGGDALTEDWAFAEPSSGAGAVAMLVSDTPYIFQVDVGANGYYGFEVMDTCRPSADTEAGNADLSLLSYLECCEQAFLAYQDRVEGADYRVSFGYLAFHTPFGGMVKGAHRAMMRKFGKVAAKEIEADFVRRVVPGLTYCQRLGNIMGATLPLSLVSTIEHAEISQASRIGCFSYGSGCCSEFFSGVATADGQARVRSLGLKSQFDRRYVLAMDEYETILRESRSVKFGTRNAMPPAGLIPSRARTGSAAPCLYLKEIREFHREYEWVS